MSPMMNVYNQGSACILSVCRGWRGDLWLQLAAELSASHGVQATHLFSPGTSDTARLPSGSFRAFHVVLESHLLLG